VVGVGTAVARGPLHRSGRAALPHPAPALGDDAKAHEGIRVADADGRKPPVDVALHPAPRQVVLLAAATQGPPPQPSHCLAESTERRAVHRDPVVPDMAPNDSPEIGALLRDGKMQAVPQLRFHFLELGLPPRTHRLPQHREATRPRLRAAMREAEETEGLGLPVAPPSPGLVGEPAKLEEARLVRVQLQAESIEPVAQLSPELHGVLPMLESDDEVVREAHDDHLAPRLPSSPAPDPEVEHVVQVEIGQERADAATLDRAGLTLCSLPLLQHAGPQPFLDEAHDAPVPHTVLGRVGRWRGAGFE